MADKITANSQFTASVFKDSFPRLAKTIPQVLYPSIHFEKYDETPDLNHETVVPLLTYGFCLVADGR